MLIVGTYNNYFDSSGVDGGRYDSLWQGIENDSVYFQRLIQLRPKETLPLYLYYKYRMFVKDYAGAVITGGQYRKMGGLRIDVMNYASLLVRVGEYERAQKLIKDRLKSNGVKEEDFEKEFLLWYLSMLYENGVYQKLIRYVHDQGASDKLENFQCFYLAVAFAVSNNRDSAFHYLECSAEKGYAPYPPLSENTVFADYHSDVRWDAIVKQCKENREKNKGTYKEQFSAKEVIKAPDFSYEDADGHKMKLSALRGKVVVINFWTDWCIFCHAAFPYLSEFALQQDSSKVKVLAIRTLSNSKNRVRDIALFKNNNYAMPLLFANNKVGEKYHLDVTGVPAFIIIDKDGYIKYRFFGFAKEFLVKDLNLLVTDLL